jgi:hypothetical protein
MVIFTGYSNKKAGVFCRFCKAQKTCRNYIFFQGPNCKSSKNTAMVAGGHCWPDSRRLRARESAGSGENERGEGGRSVFYLTCGGDASWRPESDREVAATVLFRRARQAAAYRGWEREREQRGRRDNRRRRVAGQSAQGRSRAAGQARGAGARRRWRCAEPRRPGGGTCSKGGGRARWVRLSPAAFPKTSCTLYIYSIYRGRFHSLLLQQRSLNGSLK